MKSLANLLETKTIAIVRENQRLRQVISRIVPAATLDHLLFLRIEHGRLHITVDNAVWITQLRFSERQLLAEVQSVGNKVYTVRWHVAPGEVAQSRVTRRRANEASGNAVAQVAALAQQMTDDGVAATVENDPGQAAGNPGTRVASDATEDSVSAQSDRLGQALERLARNLKNSEC